MTIPLFAEYPVHCRYQTLEAGISDAEFFECLPSCVAAPGSAVLLSGGNHDCARYSLAAGDPFLIFKSKGRLCRIETPTGITSLEADPLEILDTLVTGFKPDFPLLTEPFSGGAIGYLAYDLKNHIEKLPETVHDDLQLPDIYMFWPRKLAIHDRREKTLTHLTLSFDGDTKEDTPTRDSYYKKSSGRSGHSAPAKMTLPEPSGDASSSGPGLTCNFTHEEYLKAVSKVRHYILEGDVYQVNLSQRFRLPFHGNPFHLWSSLFNKNPAPFYAYLHAGDHQVLSTSMERFIFRNGVSLETRPIKGTRKRGQTMEEDLALKRELTQSLKDDAELSMIVDLLRNDLGRVAEPGGVRVVEHKRLESYQNVHHLVSIVSGALRPGTTFSEIIRAIFPGGSITGCPKIRAMEIIDELEPNARHIYTGAIGYLGWHDNFDFNIAIRTGVIHQGYCYFSVGGGIVYDSDEEDEYQETLHKGLTFFQTLKMFAGDSI